MRIQHNITAMNAYRNYNTNVSAVGKNLEKLSSGYKINRAGDDAAGLAVSQKMRLQIAGLAQAQKNAKSGISYIQTAEGALSEVHDMLERMYTIAEQSANGTFDDNTDRVQLQKELDQLRTEINRIGRTANFNGIGIFAEYDPSQAVGSTSGGAADDGNNGITAADITAPKSAAVTEKTAGSASDKAVYEMDLTGAAFAKDGTVAVGLGGKTYNVDVKKDMKAEDFATALKTAYDKDKITSTETGDFDMTVSGAKVTLTATKAAAVPTATATAIKKDITIAPASKTTEPNKNEEAQKVATFTGKSGDTTLDGAGITGLDFSESGLKDTDLADDAKKKVTFEYNVTSGKVLSVSAGGKTFKATLTDAAADLAGTTIELTEDGGSGKVKVTLDSDNTKVKVGSDQNTGINGGSAGTAKEIGTVEMAAPRSIERAGGAEEGDASKGTAASFKANLAGMNFTTNAAQNDTFKLTIGDGANAVSVVSEKAGATPPTDMAGVALLFDGKEFTAKDGTVYTISASTTELTFTAKEAGKATAVADGTKVALAKESGSAVLGGTLTSAVTSDAVNGTDAVTNEKPDESKGTPSSFQADLAGITVSGGAAGNTFKLTIGETVVESNAATAAVTDAKGVAALFKDKEVKIGDVTYKIGVTDTKLTFTATENGKKTPVADGTTIKLEKGTGSQTVNGTLTSNKTSGATEGTDPKTDGDDDKDTTGGGPRWFAIGAEAGEANKLTLGTMHLSTGNMTMENADGSVNTVTAGNIDSISIADQGDAWDALDKIKAATNAISDMRGTLGAAQNRLDHTIKNLSVMQENMQDAESVIRDTDVAEEMMAYTKNNILVQSAQAMLAQANQLPQGVLQLLG